MKDFLNSPPVFIEIGRGSLRAWRESGGLELTLERGADGKITSASREKAVAALHIFLGRKSWQPAVRAVCGLGAQGLSVRRLTVPMAAKSEFERVLRLQIESEFPLSPEELAWGWREISSDPARCEVLVAAVRKDLLEDYTTLLTAAGIKPEFTVAALARNRLTPAPAGMHLLIEAGADGFELVFFERGVPVMARLLPPDAAVEKTVAALGARTVFISGPAADGLLTKLSSISDCRRLAVAAGEGSSAATVGLKQGTAAGEAWLWLQVRARPGRVNLQFSFRDAVREHQQGLIRIAVLLGLLVILPYAEAILFKPMTARKIATFQAEKDHFETVVNSELDFLQSLKMNQPPYLDAMYLFASSAPQRLHVDSVSMNQHGEVALKASLQNGQQVTDFRSKLIASGFFSALSVDEQTPTPDRQKVNFRMSLQWKTAELRPRLKVELPATGTNQSNVATP